MLLSSVSCLIVVKEAEEGQPVKGKKKKRFLEHWDPFEGDKGGAY